MRESVAKLAKSFGECRVVAKLAKSFGVGEVCIPGLPKVLATFATGTLRGMRSGGKSECLIEFAF